VTPDALIWSRDTGPDAWDPDLGGLVDIMVRSAKRSAEARGSGIIVDRFTTGVEGSDDGERVRWGEYFISAEGVATVGQAAELVERAREAVRAVRSGRWGTHHLQAIVDWVNNTAHELAHGATSQPDALALRQELDAVHVSVGGEGAKEASADVGGEAIAREATPAVSEYLGWQLQSSLACGGHYGPDAGLLIHLCRAAGRNPEDFALAGVSNQAISDLSQALPDGGWGPQWAEMAVRATFLTTHEYPIERSRPRRDPGHFAAQHIVVQIQRGPAATSILNLGGKTDPPPADVSAEFDRIVAQEATRTGAENRAVAGAAHRASLAGNAQPGAPGGPAAWPASPVSPAPQPVRAAQWPITARGPGTFGPRPGGAPPPTVRHRNGGAPRDGVRTRTHAQRTL